MRQGESSITQDRDHLGGGACDVAVPVSYSDIKNETIHLQRLPRHSTNVLFLAMITKKYKKLVTRQF
jgi:hypothetical protein